MTLESAIIKEVESATVLSPFLPGTTIQYAWDSTSLGYLKTCPRLYQYIMLEGWVPKDESVHLTFGIHYHKALERYDSFRLSGAAHDDALADAVRLLLVDTRDWDVDTSHKPGSYKNPRTLVQLVIDYCDHYKDDPCKTVVRQDGTPATELSFRFELEFGPEHPAAYGNGKYTGHIDEFTDKPVFEGEKQPYLLCGHLDKVVEFSGDKFVMDHKTTTSTISPYYFDQWSPSNQMTLYTIAGQIVLHTPIKGVIIDAAQVLLEKPNNFQRGFTFRTPDQTQEWMEDLRFWLTLAERYATMGYYPQNDTACDKFGGCRFRGVCSRDPSVRDRFLEADFTQLPESERWNPLKPR